MNFKVLLISSLRETQYWKLQQTIIPQYKYSAWKRQPAGMRTMDWYTVKVQVEVDQSHTTAETVGTRKEDIYLVETNEGI